MGVVHEVEVPRTRLYFNDKLKNPRGLVGLITYQEAPSWEAVEKVSQDAEEGYDPLHLYQNEDFDNQIILLEIPSPSPPPCVLQQNISNLWWTICKIDQFQAV